MNQFKSILFALLSVLFIVSSCSIEKRVHRSGYHIDWKSTQSKSIVDQTTESDYQFTERLTLNEIKNVPTSKDKEGKIAHKNSRLDNTTGSIFSVFDDSTSNDKSDCDLIIFRDGEEIEAKVKEITQTEVKYTKCDNPNGPLFTESKSKIFMIKYPNGTNTVMKKEKDIGKEINEALGFDDDEEEEENEEKDEREEQKEENPGDRSLLIAILLWAFLGVLGIHRFYTGHYVLGVLYLLTGAFCGIGWLIDGILFLTGAYSPKRGKFTDDF